MMTGNKLAEILQKIQEAKILLIGDFCLDVYLNIDNSITERSVETGIMANAVNEFQNAPGGAGNVARNLLSLGIYRLDIVGVVGTDYYGNELQKQLHNRVFTTTGLLAVEKWQTHTFIKMIDNGREISRYDIGNYNQMTNVVADKLIAAIVRACQTCDVALINQQIIPDSGIHSPYFQRRLQAIILDNPQIPWILDSRDFGLEYSGTLRKMNEKELYKNAQQLGVGLYDPDQVQLTVQEVADLAVMVSQLWKKPVVVTRGEKETITVEDGEASIIPSTDTSHVEIDPTGAGDAFFATLGAVLGSGNDLADAVYTGNLAAGVSVRKINQTGAVTKREIEDLYFSLC
jgi:rfaE bifunctional protein kinase chain/domain